MNWNLVAPVIVIVSIKVVGMSLFFTFLPQMFPTGFQGTLNSTMEDNVTVPQTTDSLPEPQTYSTIRATTTAAVQHPKWKRHQGKFYLFSEAKENWSNSRTVCDSLGSDLVIINDKKQLEFLHNKTKNADYFIGLTYTEPQRKWLWIDDTETKSNLLQHKPKAL
uniref:C-type lectin domain-containing protein n=1 Tax=Sphenodon punctatus TaxID=8508 RepID=A0A8D0GEV5_SPHPU